MRPFLGKIISRSNHIWNVSPWGCALQHNNIMVYCLEWILGLYWDGGLHKVIFGTQTLLYNSQNIMTAVHIKRDSIKQSNKTVWSWISIQTDIQTAVIYIMTLLNQLAFYNSINFGSDSLYITHSACQNHYSATKYKPNQLSKLTNTKRLFYSLFKSWKRPNASWYII